MQFGKSKILGFALDLPIGSADSANVDLIEIPAGGGGLVITQVAYSVGSTLEAASAVELLFWRRPNGPGVTSGQRAVTFNAGDGAGQTSATLPASMSAGDVYRFYLGGDVDQDHEILPGESFAVEVETLGGTSGVNGTLTVHGYEFDVGAAIPISGGTTGLTDNQTKPGTNGAGNIINRIT